MITNDAFLKGANKVITDLCMIDEQLAFTFADGYKMVLYDNEQICCEDRYMTSDDKLSDFIGATLMSAEVKDGGGSEDDYIMYHDIQFLIITTSIGQFTMETHNIHNGYYGGFHVVAEER